jgi:membrane protein implicated in regulation of membrane protease activity
MIAMPKQFKIMIFVNGLLGFFFVVSNLVYDYFGNMPSHHALWSPLSITFYNYTFPSIGAVEPNFSFYFFWVLMIVNVYFIYRLQRSKETKQNPS